MSQLNERLLAALMNSPFYEKPSGPPPQPTPGVKGIAVRHVGQPNIVEIPIHVLEDWLTGLELAENPGDVGDVLIQMRSYLRG